MQQSDQRRLGIRQPHSLATGDGPEVYHAAVLCPRPYEGIYMLTEEAFP